MSPSTDLPTWDTDSIDVEELPAGGLRVAVSEQHELAFRTRVSRSDLEGAVWVAGRGTPGEPQFGAWPTLPDPVIVAHLAEWSARLGFVAAGLGLTTVPSLLAHSLPRGVTTIEVDDSTFSGRSMLLARIGQLKPAAAALREAIIREAAQIALWPS